MVLCISLIQKIFGFSLMVISGYVLARTGRIRGSECKVLSTVSVYLFIPCMLLSGFLIEWTPAKVEGIRLAFIGTVLIHALFLLVSRLLQRMFHYSEVDVFSLTLTNAGNILIPLVEGTLGGEYIFYTGIYMVVQNFIMWAYGIRCISGERKIQLRRIAANPPLIAIVIGFLFMLFPLHLPAAVEDTVRSLGNCTAPVAMILVGVLITGIDRGKLREMKNVWQVVLFRLLLYPVLALFLLYPFKPMFSVHPDGWQILFVLLLAASGPSASLVVQSAQLCGKETERASYINAVTTVASAVTLPAVALAAQMLLI